MDEQKKKEFLILFDGATDEIKTLVVMILKHLVQTAE